MPSRATVWCTDVVERVRGGEDPLAPWRRALATQQGSLDQPHIAAAFVLQWWCEVVAIPMAYAAELGPPALASGGAGLGFELAPGLYPHRLVLDPARVVLAWGSPDAADPAQQALPDPAQQALPDPAQQALPDPAQPSRAAAIAAGRAAYDLLVSDVVRDFAPEVKMSSRQRWGVAQDVWTAAVRRAAGAAGRPTGPEQRRISCCFIYALPGMTECVSCPRRSV